MSIAQRYARATKSSDLEVKPAAGDVDVVMAAGMAHSRLGVLLQRVRSDFDSVSRHNSLTRRLRHLRVVLVAVENYAVWLAARRKLDFSQLDIRRVTDQAVDLLLSPNCPQCTGRGSVGGYGGPICGECKGMRKRRVDFEGGDIFQDFGRQLLDELSESMHKASHQMNKRLRNY